jgi:hypothetical protein
MRISIEVNTNDLQMIDGLRHELKKIYGTGTRVDRAMVLQTAIDCLSSEHGASYMTALAFYVSHEQESQQK